MRLLGTRYPWYLRHMLLYAVLLFMETICRPVYQKYFEELGKLLNWRCNSYLWRWKLPEDLNSSPLDNTDLREQVNKGSKLCCQQAINRLSHTHTHTHIHRWMKNGVFKIAWQKWKLWENTMNIFYDIKTFLLKKPSQTFLFHCSLSFGIIFF